MIYVSQAPRPPLDAFVENLWWLSDAPPHARESILPSGTFELVINLHENEFRIYESCDGAEAKHFSGAMVSGAYHRAFVIDTLEHASIVGVHFKPGGALPFIGALPGEVGSTHIDLESVWGGARERASGAPRRGHDALEALPDLGAGVARSAAPAVQASRRCAGGARSYRAGRANRRSGRGSRVEPSPAHRALHG